MTKPTTMNDQSIETYVRALLDQMSFKEKLGQMRQIDGACTAISDDLAASVRNGDIGAIINQTDVTLCNELQRIAKEESRLGIPLLIARDVIHGFQTIMPIPLGQAATWNPTLVEHGARISALEAARCGVNWTYAPMIDISRDPRWGRIAESFGEDPYLTGVMGTASITGYQTENPSAPGAIAACAKHFVGYGASESGRDYNTTNIPPNELRNIYLPPFKTAVDAGAMSIMSSFSDIDGVPASANKYLLNGVLRGEWGFDGIAVSDWNAISELAVHGISDGDRQSAQLAINAGLDMEMAGNAYADHLEDLVNDQTIDLADIDRMVANILRTKVRLGLMANPYTDPDAFPPAGHPQALATAKTIAQESIVLLKNDKHILPLKKNELTSIAVIGPIANASYEQLGTWIFDGDPDLSITPLKAIEEHVGKELIIRYAQAMETTRSRNTTAFADAIEAAQQSDIALVFLGEESILSGEAHCRADINLPGAQSELVAALATTGTPLITVIMAGRPLTLGNIIPYTDALLFAWHPGTMGGPAISDLLFGLANPSGRLPVTFPKLVGQIPIYYNHKNTGRPPMRDAIIHIDDIKANAPQTSLGMTAFHLDAGFEPEFPFGFGLTYADIHYEALTLSAHSMRKDGFIDIDLDLSNKSEFDGDEVVQLYVRDLSASITRPVRELKAFQKVRLHAGETKTVRFRITANDLAFYNADGLFLAEPGRFHLWLGPHAQQGLHAEFLLVD